jgi:ribosomal protein S18 acetylase RimI-like enzyme
MMIIIRSPIESEMPAYYQLRWEILRKPWNQARGSEKDELESVAHHIAAFSANKIVGTGRLHLNSPNEAQIRFMAVHPDYRGMNVGTLICRKLEAIAADLKASHIILNSRESALCFYQKLGYEIVEQAHCLFGEIAHCKMRKNLKSKI